VTNIDIQREKERREKAKKVKYYGKRGDSLSDMIEKLLNYYEAKEGKPQKKVKI
jgi:hypothetical protein